MRQTAKTPSAQAKKVIQELLRQIGLARQGGECFFLGKWINGKTHAYCTSNETKDGHITMQYDHLESRSKNVSYADSRLGVVICQGLHGWKSFNDANKKIYDADIKKYLTPETITLWKRVEDDKKSYPMGIYEWNKTIIALTAELQQLKA